MCVLFAFVAYILFYPRSCFSRVHTHTHTHTHTHIHTLTMRTSRSTVIVFLSFRYTTLEGTKTIAGSCCSLLDVFYSLITTHGATIGDAVAMLATTPARIAGLTHVGEVPCNRAARMLPFSADTSSSSLFHISMSRQNPMRPHCQSF